MTNNRMWLVNSATGQRVLIARHSLAEWCSTGGIENELDGAFVSEVDEFSSIIGSDSGSTAWRIEYEAGDRSSQNHGLDTDARVRFYEHDFYPLSNFSAFTLIWRDLRFDTSEAAYHWEKFPGEDDESRLVRGSIQCAPSAHEAYRIAFGSRALRRPDWDDVKVDVMREILRAKVAQHEYVRRKLLATGERELVEDSWRDDFWGWGPNRDGQNRLGRLWMEIRAELRSA